MVAGSPGLVARDCNRETGHARGASNAREILDVHLAIKGTEGRRRGAPGCEGVGSRENVVGLPTGTGYRGPQLHIDGDNVHLQQHAAAGELITLRAGGRGCGGEEDEASEASAHKLLLLG